MLVFVPVDERLIWYLCCVELVHILVMFVAALVCDSDGAA